MNKRRLLKLAKLLEDDARNKKGVKFDLGDWGETKTEKPELSCGTTACAIGLACISGAFKKQGFTYSDGFIRSGWIAPVYRDANEWGAVCDFFELNLSDAHSLFLDTSYPNKLRTGAAAERAVAKRIRDFVAGKARP
jgi:hypothetical protein